MFQEEEPGKPRNWCFTITIIMAISLINVLIFVVIRILLDSENEFDEPIIQGKLREQLTKFLGIFALSFCFGCWCCFCCAGNCFRWFLYLNPKKWEIGHWWASLIGHKFALKRKVPVQNIKRKQDENLELDEFSISDYANGNQNKNQKDIFPEHSMTSSEFDFDMNEKISPIHSTISNSSNSNERQSEKTNRPIDLTITNKKSDKQKQEKFSMDRVRRWSTAPVSSDVLVKMSDGSPGIINKFDGNEGKRKESSVIAVRGIDFVQIPIQMLTSSTVAIVDREKINQAEESPETERKIKRKITQ